MVPIQFIEFSFFFFLNSVFKPEQKKLWETQLCQNWINLTSNENFPMGDKFDFGSLPENSLFFFCGCMCIFIIFHGSMFILINFQISVFLNAF